MPQPCEVLEFSTGRLELSGSGRADLSSKLFEVFVEGVLRAMPFFGGLSPSVMRQVVKLFRLEELPPVSSVFEEAEAGDGFYVLAYGRVEVCKGSQQVALLDGQANDGHPFFGEMALLDGQPRMASIRTLSPCRLLVLGRAYFFRFLSLVKVVAVVVAVVVV